MHFPRQNIISGGIEPFKKCMLQGGPSSHCGCSPVHPWVPLLLSPVWFQWNCQRIDICMLSSLAKEL
jgi:hypothetical protein